MPEVIDSNTIRRVEMVKALEASMMGMFAAFDTDPTCSEYWSEVKSCLVQAHIKVSGMTPSDVEHRIWDELKRKHNIQRPSPIAQVSMRESIRR